MDKKLLYFVRSLFLNFSNLSGGKFFSLNFGLLSVGIFFFVSSSGYSQCGTTFPTSFTTSKVDNDQFFCIDGSSSTLTVDLVGAQEYVVLNVISGYNYTAQIPNIWNNNNESLTIYNDATNARITSNSSSGGTSVTWTSAISGKVKILLTRGSSCNTTTSNASDTMTLTLNSTGDNLAGDAPNTIVAANDTWVGYIYNSSGATPEPFSTAANYAGYYTINSESFTEGFGGSGGCFDVYSNGAKRATMYAEEFAVRYRMKSSRAAGCYFIKVTGDDGVRLSINGTSVFDRWVEQGATSYSYIMVNLPANATFTLDYYENRTDNNVGFEITPFDPAVNTIIQPSTINFCNGGDAGVINGSMLYNSGNVDDASPYINFKWQLSTNGGLNFNDITNATSRTFDPPAYAANGGATDLVYQYRRIATVNTTKVPGATCTFNVSNVVTITNFRTSVGGTTSSAQSICSGTSPANITLTGNVGAVTKWQRSTDPSFNTGVTDIAGTSTTLTGVSIGNLTTTTYFRAVVQNGNCTVANSSIVTVTVVPVTVAGTITITNGNSCYQLASNSTTFTLSGNTGSVLRWESSTDNFVSVIIPITNTTSNLAVNNLTTTTYYRAVVKSGSCSTVYSNILRIATGSPIATAATLPLCNGFTANWTKVPGATTYLLDVSTNGFSTFVLNSADVGDNASYTVTGLLPNTAYTYRVSAVYACGVYAIPSNSISITTASLAPIAAIAGGSATVCVSSLTPAFTNATSGGVWSITPGSGTASITTGGVVTGLTAGTVTVDYTVTSGGCSSKATKTLTINPLPTVAAIAGGSATVCVSSLTPAFTNATPGGVWSITPGSGTASITTGGVVTGLTAGTVTVDYTVTSGGCSNKATQALTINPLPTVAAIAGGSATVCVSSSTPAFTNATSGGVWSITPGSGTASITTGGVVTGLTAGTVTVDYTVNSGGCSNKASISLTVNPTPSAPTASVTKQPTCSELTGTITVTVPAPGPGIRYSIGGGDYSNDTGIFLNVAPNTYNVTTQNASGCKSSATTVTVNNPSGKMWNGSTDNDWTNPANWTPAGVPGDTDCVVIPTVVMPTTVKQPIILTTADAYSLTVGSGVILTVNSKAILTVVSNITVNTDGKLIFEDSSSLLQKTDNAVNTGNITYKRITSAIRRYDFTDWSSPIHSTPAFTLHDVSPLTLADKYYSYDPTKGWIVSYNGALPMVPGMGYIIRGPQHYDIVNPAPFQASFIGIPNNGTIQVTAEANKYISVGNPYPSAVNALDFIDDNSAAGVDVGALYFWTHNSPPVNSIPGDKKYYYNTADYAVFSKTGSTESKSGANDSKPSGFIAAGASFFIKPTGTKILFTNSMRVGIKNDQFYKTANNSEGKNRLWLNFANTEGAFKQALIGYMDGATNDWDYNYDASTFNGNAYVDFYSINEKSKLTIQGRALPFNDSDLVPLGYVSKIVGDFTISIDEADGLFDTQAVYLEDKKTGKITDLRAGNYTFATEKGTFDDRFVLRYTNKTLGTGDFENIENGLLVAVKDKTVKIISANESIKEVTIFDINGKLLYDKKKIGSTELQVSNLHAANQVLLVKVMLENGFTTTRKIIFQ